jgi:spore maturation protein CgeB
MTSARLQISAGMRERFDYRKFTGPTRMLVLETDYFFERSWKNAAAALGWEVASVQSAMTGDIGREVVRDLFFTLAEFKPDFILASNYSGMDVAGIFSRFFEDVRIPYVSWFTDTPRMILCERTYRPSHYSVAATWERGFESHFDLVGFEHVFFMPLATDLSLFDGDVRDRCERPLAFVGNSMIELAAEAWGRMEEIPGATKAILSAFSGGKITRESFSHGIRSLLPADLLDGLSPTELRNIELCLLYEATRRQRSELCFRLASRGLTVRGDLRWLEVVPCVDGPVGYFNDLAPFYRDTLVNLNSTSIQMKGAVNQRVFDCPAAGGFIITDAQGDIEDLFDSAKEMVTYSSLEELEDKVDYFTRKPEARIPIVRRARKRIEENHTHMHRLRSLEAYLREIYG